MLRPAALAGAIPLAIHPAIVFTGTSIDLAHLREASCAVAAPAPVLPIAQALVVELGAEPVVVDERDRVVRTIGPQGRQRGQTPGGDGGERLGRRLATQRKLAGEQLDTVRLHAFAEKDDLDIDIWLSRRHGLLPVRIRITDDKGGVLDQRASRIEAGAAATAARKPN